VARSWLRNHETKERRKRSGDTHGGPLGTKKGQEGSGGARGGGKRIDVHLWPSGEFKGDSGGGRGLGWGGKRWGRTKGAKSEKKKNGWVAAKTPEPGRKKKRTPGIHLRNEKAKYPSGLTKLWGNGPKAQTLKNDATGERGGGGEGGRKGIGAAKKKKTT